MRIEHTLPRDLLGQRAVRVLVVGAGGTGSAIVMGLPYLDQAMRVWGRSSGLEVVMMFRRRTVSASRFRPPTLGRTRPLS
jgi:shikimate 5-dehydrogenase